MSKPTTTLEEQSQQLFSKLSIQYKAPLRNILGEAEEVVQNTISSLIRQLIAIHNSLADSNQEITRLQKLCSDNNISFQAPNPNNTERKIPVSEVKTTPVKVETTPVKVETTPVKVETTPDIKN